MEQVLDSKCALRKAKLLVHFLNFCLVVKYLGCIFWPAKQVPQLSFKSKVMSSKREFVWFSRNLNASTFVLFCSVWQSAYKYRRSKRGQQNDDFEENTEGAGEASSHERSQYSRKCLMNGSKLRTSPTADKLIKRHFGSIEVNEFKFVEEAWGSQTTKYLQCLWLVGQEETTQYITLMCPIQQGSQKASRSGRPRSNEEAEWRWGFQVTSERKQELL